MNEDNKEIRVEEEKKIDESLDVFIPDIKEYKVRNSEGRILIFVQRPLVLKDLKSVIKEISLILSVIKDSENKLKLKEEKENDLFESNSFLKLAMSTDEGLEHFYNLLAIIVFPKDKNIKYDDYRSFLIENMPVKMFSIVISDFFELNDIKEMIENFTKAFANVTKAKASLK